jgi:tRNA G37 N-methylase TrmD
MRFEIITIFPGLFAGIFEHGIVRRAQAEGLVSVDCLIYGTSRMTGIARWTIDRLAVVKVWC